MNVLVIGSGGREHALCWRLRASQSVQKLFCAPGNPGIAGVATCVPIDAGDIDALAAWATSNDINLTVVGPELPLSLGIVDLFESRGLRIFGPSKAAAMIEGSKNFAKEIMQAAGVPTAGAVVVRSAEEARAYVKGRPLPIVLKADGLAAGKGVCVCQTPKEVTDGISFLFGESKSATVLVEDFLEGKEASFIVATDGVSIVPFPSAHDYKRVGDGDRGPNTGGMGTVSPTPNLSVDQEKWASEYVIKPVLSELTRRSIRFRGFLYAGLMISPNGKINVLEFNARFGDPECQSVMRRLTGDLATVLFELSDPNASGGLKGGVVTASKEAAVTVVLASAGYPQDPRKGDAIHGINLAESMPEVVVFHAGTTRQNDGTLVTSGGRVLNVTALGRDINEARARAYKAADMIQFRGVQLRRDIGAER